MTRKRPTRIYLRHLHRELTILHHPTQAKRHKPRTSGSDSGDRTDFVRCRICGKHLRVISGLHLRIHGIDREAYMQRYRLSPDKLCSKSFRLNHSSRSDYCPHNKHEWIAAIKNFSNSTATSTLAICRSTIRIYISKGFGYLVIGTQLCVRPASQQRI